MSKPKVATASLAGCFGCHMSILDIDDRILKLIDLVDFDKSPVDDIKEFTDYVYGGNVLILDFSPIAEEEVILKRITNDLKKLTEEINGDIAGIGNNLMIIAPSDVKIERRIFL